MITGTLMYDVEVSCDTQQDLTSLQDKILKTVQEFENVSSIKLVDDSLVDSEDDEDSDSGE